MTVVIISVIFAVAVGSAVIIWVCWRGHGRHRRQPVLVETLSTLYELAVLTRDARTRIAAARAGNPHNLH